MRIALVSKTNGCFGGASFFAENLGAWLVESGHETVHFCVEPRRPLRPYQRQLVSAGLASRMVRHLNWRARRLGMVEPLPWEYWFGLRQNLANFDIIHFHDLHMAISPRSLMKVAQHLPVVFTTHDTSAFTGGCINPVGCRRFETTCGRCPQSPSLGQFDFTRRNLRLMRRLARTHVSYVFPSRWIQQEAGRSLRPAVRTEHIPNGFDPRSYRFRTRAEARATLGIAADRKVVALAAASLDNKLKGVSYALRALDSVKHLDPLAIVMGRASPEVEQELHGTASLLAGFVEDRERIGLLLGAADVLIYPSLGDNLPITVQEAMAAGTPVLAFAVGGVPELVRHNQTGWLVPAGNQEALNLALRESLQSAARADLGRRARELVLSEFSSRRCVESHLELYRRLAMGGRES